MLDPALHVPHPPAGVALVPGAIELLGGCPELHDEVAGQVLRLGLAPLLAPKADQGRFIAAHDDPGVRAADEGAAVLVGLCPHLRFHDFLDGQMIASANRTVYDHRPIG